MRRIALCVLLALAAILVSRQAPAPLLRGGSAPPSAPYIASISPTSASVPDNVSPNTTIAHLQCHMNTGALCPPNVAWTLSQPYPSFVGLSATQPDGTVFLQAVSTPGVGADGGPSFNSNTFAINVNLSTTTPQVASISPTTLSIPNTTAQGTVYRFVCAMSDSSSCANKTWSFAGYPSFLTPSSDASGGILTTNQAPPLPVSSGTLTVTAQ